jgi:hypothetical protein
MKKSIKVTPKKRRGRPATGRDPHITARMPSALIVEVEAWAAANDASRSEAIRRLVELGLQKDKGFMRFHRTIPFELVVRRLGLKVKSR